MTVKLAVTSICMLVFFDLLSQVDIGACCDPKVDLRCSLFDLQLAQDEWVQASEVLEAILQEQAPDEQCLIRAIGFYRNWLKQEPNEPITRKVKSRIMELYDQRLGDYHDSVSVLNLKSFEAYKYYRKDTARLEWLVKLFDQCAHVSGKDMSYGNIIAYVDMLRRYQKYNASLSNRTLWEKYDFILDLVQLKIEDQGMNQNPHRDELEDLYDKLISMMAPHPNEICDDLLLIFQKQFNQGPTNVRLAKRIVAVYNVNQCNKDSELYQRAVLLVTRLDR